MLIGRKKEQEWLEKALERSSLLCLWGEAGIGKTFLLRHWPQLSAYKVQWVLHHPYRTFLDTLNFTFECNYQSLEAFLSGECAQWSQKLLVWENLHLLPEASLGIFLGHLQIFSGKHVLMARAPLAIPIPALKLELGRLTLAEIKEMRPNEAQSLFDQSQGHPQKLGELLAQVDLQHSSTRSWEELPPQEKEMLLALQLLARPVKLPFIQQIWNISRECLDTLIQEAFLEFQGNALSSLRDQGSKILAPAMLSSVRQKIWQLLSLDPEAGPLERLLHALVLNDEHLVHQTLQAFPVAVDSLDSYNPKLLRSFLERVRALKKVSVALTHLAARAYFILGERAQSVALLKNYFNQHAQNWDEAHQKLGVEYVQLLCRQENFKEALDFIDQNFAYMGPAERRLLSIEKAVAYLSSGASQRQEGEQILQRLLKDLEAMTDENTKAVKAQASFQLARAYYHQNQLAQAKQFFLPAARIFKDIGRPYFAAISDFNLAWIALRSGEITELKTIIEELKKTTALYGYAILSSGLELLEAKLLRLNLRADEALGLLETSLKRMGEAAPPQVLIDIYLEKSRVLDQLGLIHLAQETLAQVERFYVKKDPSPELKILRIKIQCHHLSLEEARDIWSTVEDIPQEDFLREQFLLGLGEEVPLAQAFTSLALVKLSVALSQLMAGLKAEDEDKVVGMLAELDQILLQVPGPLLEKAALRLLEATLTKNEKERASLLSQAKLELARSQADDLVKGPLEAWWLALESGTDPEESLKFKKATLGAREKWQLWWRPFREQEASQLMMISKEGKKAVKDLAQLKKAKGVLLLEDRHEVWFNGKLQHTLIGRHQVRKLLSLLMEAYPAALKKEELATVLWGESYNPLTHDVRLYTAASRLRDFLPENIILNTSEGYQFNGEYNFRLVKAQKRGAEKHRLETLILETLSAFHKNGQSWVGRKVLKESTGASDSSLKRALSKLLGESLIIRQGSGAGVKYAPGKAF